jgi:hypothetical protein
VPGAAVDSLVGDAVDCLKRRSAPGRRPPAAVPEQTPASLFLPETRMKKLLAIAIAGAFALSAAPSFAADNAQQERMKTCNKKAAGMKGDERKKFMSDCLSKEKNSQQEKMKSCNTKAAGMKGDERKKFMSECLKG